MPAYNQAQYIAQAIQSVLDQSFTNFELIVVNDGSTDATPEILATFSDPRLRVIHQQNGGLSAARNTGIRHSTASWITFLDSDDLLRPDHLAVLYGYLQQHPALGLVAGQSWLIDADGQIVDRRQSQHVRPLTLHSLLLGNPIRNTACTLIRREWVERVGCFDHSLRACEDWDMWIRLARAGCPMVKIEPAVMLYRIHTQQMTGELERMRRSRLAVIEKFFAQSDLPDSISALHDQAVASVLIKVAALAYRLADYQTGQADLREAVRLDPELKAQRYRRLVEEIMKWIYIPQIPDPVAYLQRITANLPLELHDLRPELRRAAASVLLQPLFAGGADRWRRQRRALLKAIEYDPSWLFNRGVLRMLIEAWIPLSTARRL